MEKPTGSEEERLRQENATLRAIIRKLQAEVEKLKAKSISMWGE
jgi:predicted RNase H-like nuclease (RuvC/YqgF family)